MEPEIQDAKLRNLANIHLLESACSYMLEAIDNKLEGVSDPTVSVNVTALETLRTIISTQSSVIKDLVERSAQIEDRLEILLSAVQKAE